MTDGGEDFNLGHVVGSDGAKGDDGSTVWNTSTAPTYANSKYTFTKSNLSGKTGLQIAVNDIIFYSTYYYIVSTVNTTTVDCSTRVSIKGSDASVTIVDNLTSDSSTSVLSAKQGKVLNTNKIETSAIATSFGSTTSDSKVPSEKLVKTELDKKIATSNTAGLVKNDGTIDTNTYLTSSSLSNYVAKSETTGLLKNDGTVDTNSYSTTSHTHGQVTSDGKVTSTAVTVASGDNILITDYSDSSKIKRVANILADHVKDSTAHSNIGSSASATQATINSSIDTALSNKVSKSQTSGLLKNDGTVDTTSYSTFSGSYTDLTNKPSIPSSSSDLSDGSSLVKTSSTTGLLKNDGTIMTSGTGSSNYSAGNHTHSGYVSATKVTSWSGTVSDSNVPSEKLVKNSLDDKIGKSSTSGLVKNDGTIDTNSYLTTSSASSTYQPKLTSGTNIKTINNESLLGSGNITIQGGSSVDVVTSWEATLSDTKVPSEKLVKNTIDGLSIPTKTSDLTNDGADGTNVFVANNDSRLSDSRTPTSHTHGNLTNDGKVGSNANYIVVTGTGGAITSVQKLGNITYDGKIGSTSGKPIITTTSGTLTTGSFGSTSGTFAEGNHTHSGYISTSSTTGLVKNDGTIMTSGTGSSNYAAGNHTHSGYVSATKVTSWQSTPSDSNVPSEKLVKDSLDDIEDLIGDAITYINQ